MDNKIFPILNRREGVTAVRAKQVKLRNILIVIMKSAVTDFALILTVTAVIIIDILMGSTTKRADNGMRNISAIAAMNRFNGYTIPFMIIFDKKGIVLFNRIKNYRQFINLKLLILWRTRIVKDKLLKWNKSANKVAEI